MLYMIVEHFKNDVTYYEPRNEPNFGSSGGDFVKNEMADFYKTETTIPLAFEVAAKEQKDLERLVRIQSRQVFHQARLMDRLLPDIAEVLGVSDDSGESAADMEGRAVTLALGDPLGDVPGQSQSESSG